MYFTLFSTLLLCISASRLYVSGLKAEAWPPVDEKLYSEVVKLNTRLRQVNGDSQPGDLHRYKNVCGKHITEGPGRIQQDLGRKDQHCTFTIQAPVGYHVYISAINYPVEYATPTRAHYEGLQINVYDGDKVSESKYLFRLGDKSLDNALSSERDLTVDVDYKAEEGYSFDYGFIYEFVEDKKVKSLLTKKA